VSALLSTWAHKTYDGSLSEGEREAYGRCVDEVLTQFHFLHADDSHPFESYLELICINWKTTMMAWPDDERAVYQECVDGLKNALGADQCVT